MLKVFLHSVSINGLIGLHEEFYFWHFAQRHDDENKQFCRAKSFVILDN